MPGRDERGPVRLADPPPGWLDYGALQDRLVQSEAAQRLARIERLSTSLWVFERNSAALGSALAHADSPQGFADLLAPDERSRLRSFLLEVVRLFYNYVSSARSLVDHTRRFYEEHYEPVGAIADYRAEVDARFKEAPVVAFVHGFRNYLEHRELPGLISNVHWFGDLRHLVVLSQAELLRYKKWSSAAKAFLRGSEEHIPLEAVRRAYDDRVSEFHRWFRGRLMEHHAADLAEIERMRAEIEPAARQLRTAIFQDNMRKGPRTIADAFKLLLHESDLGHLAAQYPDPATLVDAVVAVARTAFDVSEAERETLVALFGRS